MAVLGEMYTFYESLLYSLQRSPEPLSGSWIGISPATFARNKGQLVSTKCRRITLDVYLKLCILFVNI